MRKLIILAGVICSIAANAQTFRHYITTDDALMDTRSGR